MSSAPTVLANSALADKAPGEKEQKDKALQERLEKRAHVIAVSMRKFLTAYWVARQKMLDDARAAEEAKKLRGKKKKGKAKNSVQEAKGSDKKKKVTKTLVQESWSAFLGDIDDRINKQKRCTLEDMYRGVSKLSPEDRRALACIVVASNNKKVLPTEGININMLNIREALFAAVASFDVPVEKATLSASSALSLVAQRGASEEQLLHHGFKAWDLLRVGCSRPEVISLAAHTPSLLHKAGVTADELLQPDAAGGLLAAPQRPEQHLGGYQGAVALKLAGYTARDISVLSVHTPWDLKQAGFSSKELIEAGVSAEDMVTSGFAEPKLQPTSFLADTFSKVCGIHVSSLPQFGMGTTSDKWQALMSGDL